MPTANSKPNGNSGYNQLYNRGGRGGRGFNGQSPQYSHFNQFQQSQSNAASSRLERPTCQICGNLGHLAIDCYHRMDYAYQGKHPPTKLVLWSLHPTIC